MKILYAATDTIAVPLLEALASRNLVRAVFTAPDAPGKRGKTLLPTPIKAKALELGLEVYTPLHLRTEERRIYEVWSGGHQGACENGRQLGSVRPRYIPLHPPVPVFDRPDACAARRA